LYDSTRIFSKEKSKIMKPKKLLLFFSAFAIISFQSCAPAYIPNRVNSPMFKNAGEITGEISVGQSGFDPQIAVAVTDHIAVMANGSFALPQSDNVDSLDFHRHSFFEGGLGYYKKLDDRRFFEIFGGFGKGTVDTYWENGAIISDVRVKSTYNRFFIQPTIGMSNRVVDLGFTNRFVLVQMNVDDQYLNNYVINNYDYFWEPAFTFRVGGPNVKFSTQVGFSIPVNQMSENSYEHRWFMASLGMQMRLNRK
jgi:hypothetical protein